MFRAREISIYEKKLIEAGINVKSMLGKNLLDRMIDVNSHEDIEIEISFELNKMVEGDIYERGRDYSRRLYWNHPRSRINRPILGEWSIDEWWEGLGEDYPSGWTYNLYPNTRSSQDDFMRSRRRSAYYIF